MITNSHKSNTHIHTHKHAKHFNNKRIWSLGRRTKTGWIYGNDQLYWLNTSYTSTNNSRCRSRGSSARQSSDWRPRQFTCVARRKFDHQQKCIVVDEVSFRFEMEKSWIENLRSYRGVQWNSPKNQAKPQSWSPQPMVTTTGANYRPMVRNLKLTFDILRL